MTPTKIADEDRYYVYAVLCQDEGGPGYVKFGFSGNIGTRLSSIATNSPVPAKYFAVSLVGNNRETAIRVEKALHNEFEHRHVRGEWFRFDFSSEADKWEFNDLCLVAFRSILGDRYDWWTKINVSEFRKYMRKRKAAALSSGRVRKLQSKKRLNDAIQNAWGELDVYGDAG